MLKEIAVPDIGDFSDVAIIEVLVTAGDQISEGQPIVAFESDKAVIEIPSPMPGIVRGISVKPGDRVSKGALLLTLDECAAVPVPKAESPAPSPLPAVSADDWGGASTQGATANKPQPERLPPVVPMGADASPYASPGVLKYARELGVDILRVRGTGPHQRVTQEDVRSFVKSAVTQTQTASDSGHMSGILPWPKIDFAKFGPIETKPLTRIKKITGANLHRNWVMIPHVTSHDEIDITDLEAQRVQLNKAHEADGIKLTMPAFLIKACVDALKKFPDFNASLDGDDLVLKKHYHIGFAADTPTGLVVPVIKDADRKSVIDIAKEVAGLAKLAREGKLKPSDMQGGTFSISSLGGIGGRYITPIINAPEVAILGACRAEKRPHWDEAKAAFVPRSMLPLSLSWDHRVIDGAAAARFLAELGRAMGCSHELPVTAL